VIENGLEFTVHALMFKMQLKPVCLAFVLAKVKVCTGDPWG